MARTVSQPRPAAVAAVLATAPTWVSARRKSDGKPFFFVPGSKPGAVYMTAEDGCTCPAARNAADGRCKHQEAVRQHKARHHQPSATDYLADLNRQIDARKRTLRCIGFEPGEEIEDATYARLLEMRDKVKLTIAERPIALNLPE